MLSVRQDTLNSSWFGIQKWSQWAGLTAYALGQTAQDTKHAGFRGMLGAGGPVGCLQASEMERTALSPRPDGNLVRLWPDPRVLELALCRGHLLPGRVPAPTV